MSWLSKSMNPDIAEDFLLLDLANEVWDSVREIYGEKENLARIYQLQQEINRMTRDKPFHTYFSSLKSMWDEL